MTAQLEHSHCPLVETDSITSLFIVYRYDSTTGTFTVPPGGGGFYYFSVYLANPGTENHRFDIQINRNLLCTAYTDEDDTNWQGQAACSIAIYATEGRLYQWSVEINSNSNFYCLKCLHLLTGDEVQVVYRLGDDTTPLETATTYYYNGFTGFRI